MPARAPRRAAAARRIRSVRVRAGVRVISGLLTARVDRSCRPAVFEPVPTCRAGSELRQVFPPPRLSGFSAARGR